MTHKKRFLKILYKSGMSANLIRLTGDQCPCMVFEDPDVPSYSPEWHRLNPTAENCNRTGLINTVETTIAIKSIFYSVALKVQSLNLEKEILDKIGEWQKDDLLMYGCVKVADMSEIDLRTLNENVDKIQYDGKLYIPRHTLDVATNEIIGSLCLIKRIQ